mmetsp:Transcript_116561/g.293167  ORF Transcript_116561/g.293167 Transcript_116561/m.293167 type:complete len:249 (+) Transcript_116561:631-1377(+)
MNWISIPPCTAVFAGCIHCHPLAVQGAFGPCRGHGRSGFGPVRTKAMPAATVTEPPAAAVAAASAVADPVHLPRAASRRGSCPSKSILQSPAVVRKCRVRTFVSLRRGMLRAVSALGLWSLGGTARGGMQSSVQSRRWLAARAGRGQRRSVPPSFRAAMCCISTSQFRSSLTQAPELPCLPGSMASRGLLRSRRSCGTPWARIAKVYVGSLSDAPETASWLRGRIARCSSHASTACWALPRRMQWPLC